MRVCAVRTFRWKLFQYKLWQNCIEIESTHTLAISGYTKARPFHAIPDFVLRYIDRPAASGCCSLTQSHCSAIQLEDAHYVLEIVRPENDLKLFSYCAAINNGKPMCWTGVADKVFIFSVRRFSNLMRRYEQVFHAIPFACCAVYTICISNLCTRSTTTKLYSLTLCDSELLCSTSENTHTQNCSRWQMIDFMDRHRQYRWHE